MHLICDGFNLFLRSWAAYPQMSTHGYQMGGCVGFLKTLGWMSEQFKPTHIHIVWESGGSPKRRRLYSEYKKNRGKSEKLNRFYGEDIPESDENKVHQIKVLTMILNELPVRQLYVPNCEGDDVIAYITQGPLVNEEKIIVSTDKDMYQLMDDKTRVFNLYTKKLLTYHDIAEQYLITASNFGVAKAICGDVSDNIPGVKGVGFKTLAKNIDIMRTHDDLLVKDVISFCAARRDDSKFYKKIVESREIIERNWALIHLDVSSLSASQSKIIDTTLNNPPSVGNRINVMRHLINEGVNNFDVGQLFSSVALPKKIAEEEQAENKENE